MKRISYRRYILLGAIFFVVMSMPAFFVEGLRLRFIASLSFFRKSKAPSKEELELGRLESENHLLRIEIGKLLSILEQSHVLERFQQELKKDLPPKRYEESSFLLGLQVEAVPARVIFRDPANWSSSLWINVGAKTNQRYGKNVIRKNSPVLVGRAAVGVVDYVGQNQSRVRLITDRGLNPSVRAVRGLSQNLLLSEHLEVLLRHLHSRKDFPLNATEQGTLIQHLEKFKQGLIQDSGESWYLAKGIIHGAGTPLWRSANHVLKGVGFNYDFSDSEGPARELVSGKTIPPSSLLALPLLKVGDMLVTTGMDGVFPPGLRIAEVSKVYPLKEGAYTYDIDAIPVVGNLDTLQTLFVIPPVGYDLEDQTQFPWIKGPK